MSILGAGAAQETAKQTGIALKPADASTLAPLPPAQPIDPRIKKVAGEFESMVIGELLQPMFESADVNGPFGGGSGEAMFRPMLVEQYAKAMSKAGGIGIADEVAREMMRLQGAAAAPQPAAPSTENDHGADR